MSDGWWEELGYVWMRDFEFEDDPGEYKRINRFLPEEYAVMPLYHPDGDRVKVMQWRED